ncbi:MAG: glycosyltransferase family 4 protein, partial [Candidatus Micrarchaeota archaeon]
RDEFLVLCVSRMDPRKGQEVLVRAMKKVVAEVPNAKCVFVGNGSFSQELLKKERGGVHKKLIDAVDELGLAEKVIFTGYLPDNEVNKLYAAADVVVQPSFQEGFGLTVTEGMLFGKAVIGSRVGGLMVQIKDGENGFLFTPGDSDGLSERIIAIALDKQLREKMGITGRAYVEFLKSEGFSRHLRMYRGLCEEHEKLCRAP